MSIIIVDDYIDLTEDQLDKLSEISDADIEKAKILWRQSVDDEFKELLDAPVLSDVIEIEEE